MTLGDRIVTRSRAVGNPVCLGLDPRQESLPSSLFEEARSALPNNTGEGEVIAAAIQLFCDRVLDRVAHRVLAVKPQVAFFEALGGKGLAVFDHVCRQASTKGTLVIADVKRGDIGTTATAYAKAYLSPLHEIFPMADAVTVNPYLGSDGIRPFLEVGQTTERGAFILVKTSNPSSRELQDRTLKEGGCVSDHVAALVTALNDHEVSATGYGSLGAVVGATWPEELERLRLALPGSHILLPGYGAQGAQAEDTVAAFDGDAQGAIVSASRSLTFPWGAGPGPADYLDRIEEAVDRMIRDLHRVLHG